MTFIAAGFFASVRVAASTPLSATLCFVKLIFSLIFCLRIQEETQTFYVNYELLRQIDFLSKLLLATTICENLISY